MEYKVIEKNKYSLLLNVAVMASAGFIIMTYFVFNEIAEKQKIEDDLRMVIALHNEKNHALKACEDNIIEGTCLTKLPTYQEAAR